MQNIINFIKYHNLVPIILGLVLLTTAGAFANEDVRNAVIGEEIITEQGIDNSLVISADLDNFDMALQIQNVAEDEEKYYVDYIFKTIAIQGNSWQEVWREKRLAVSKKHLGDEDLTSSVMEELGQVIDNELAYLKEVQVIERERGPQKIVSSVEYTGLRGLFNDLKERMLPEPICQPTDEVCDGVDNDCDGSIDEDLGQTVCGLGACQVAVDKCLDGALLACVPRTPTKEVCGDNIDNNCDGTVDNPEICQQSEPPTEEPPTEEPPTEEPPTEEPPTEEPPTEEPPTEEPPTEEPPTCQPTEEVCDGIDNNCDGEIDEGGVCSGGESSTEEPPAEDVCDEDHLNLCLTQLECESVGGFWYSEVCNAEEFVDDGQEEEEEEPLACEPTEEICDGIDNDCDEEVDEDVDCGETSCDTSLNLTGSCQNSCSEGSCQVCVPSCACADGFSDCDGDTSNGCEEVSDECSPSEPPEEPEEPEE
jgi:hypothetical protein